MTGGPRRHDGGDRVLRQEPNHNVTMSQSSGRGPEPAVTHAGPHDSPMSYPTFLIPLCHSRHFQSPLSFPMFSIPPLSFPTFLSGIQGFPHAEPHK